MNKVEKHRQDAFRHLASCELRYKDQYWARVPLYYARRWARAFENSEVNLDEIAQIVRDVEQERGNYDIVFHTFAVDMRNIYQEL